MTKKLILEGICEFHSFPDDRVVKMQSVIQTSSGIYGVAPDGKLYHSCEEARTIPMTSPAARTIADIALKLGVITEKQYGLVPRPSQHAEAV